MHTCTAAFALLLAAPLCLAQQVPLPLSQLGNNEGAVGGAFYFDLTCTQPVTITRFDYVTGTISPAGSSSVEVWLGPSTWVGNVAVNPGPWALAGTTAPVAIAGGTTTPVVGLLPTGITLAPGTYGVALRAVGHSWRYLNGSVTFADGVVAVANGGAANTFLALPSFAPRTPMGTLHYEIGGPGFASVAPYGAGCYARYRSLYERFPAAALFDLANRSMRFVFEPAFNRYSAVVPGLTPVAPSSSPSLGHGDDQHLPIALGPAGAPQPIVFPGPTGPGSTTAVQMSSNLFLLLQGSTPSVGLPALASWLGDAAVRIGCHRDVDPSSGGTTHYDFDAASGAHLFTWRAVPDRLFVLGANTFQIACFANGDVELRFGAMSQAPGYAFPMLVGFTPGHGALDPGSTDLSAQLPLQPPLATFPVDQRPLGLVASGLPELGTTIGLQATNPTATSFGAVFVGVDALFPVSPVGADLGAIGAPGCVLNIDLAPSVSALIGNGPGGSLTMPLSIPNVPALVGARFYAQAAWIDPLRQNAAFGTVGLLTSNALRLTIG